MSPQTTKIGPGGPILSHADGCSDELLAQQREHALRGLVGLREHARAGLLQDVQLRELGHLRRHVHVADARSDAVRFSW